MEALIDATSLCGYGWLSCRKRVLPKTKLPHNMRLPHNIRLSHQNNLYYLAIADFTSLFTLNLDRLQLIPNPKIITADVTHQPRQILGGQDDVAKNAIPRKHSKTDTNFIMRMNKPYTNLKRNTQSMWTRWWLSCSQVSMRTPTASPRVLCHVLSPCSQTKSLSQIPFLLWFGFSLVCSPLIFLLQHSISA